MNGSEIVQYGWDPKMLKYHQRNVYSSVLRFIQYQSTSVSNGWKIQQNTLKTTQHGEQARLQLLMRIHEIKYLWKWIRWIVGLQSHQFACMCSWSICHTIRLLIPCWMITSEPGKFESQKNCFWTHGWVYTNGWIRLRLCSRCDTWQFLIVCF